MFENQPNFNDRPIDSEPLVHVPNNMGRVIDTAAALACVTSQRRDDPVIALLKDAK